MKRRTRISFWVPREARDKGYRLLERIDCLEGWHEALQSLPRSNPGFAFVFTGDDPRLEAIRLQMRGIGRNWNEIHECLYEDSELRESPLLLLGLRERLFLGGGTQFGTQYDVSSACPHCGTGAVQTSPLMLPAVRFSEKGHICGTYLDHFLVSTELAKALLKARVTGLELRQAHSYRSQKSLPWWQMIGTYTMPRMSPQTKGVFHDMRPGWGCAYCQRDCYEGMEEMVYSLDDVRPSAVPDVVQTWECFSRSVLHDDPERNLRRDFGQPLLLMKPRVFDVFRELKVKSAEFSPVRFV